MAGELLIFQETEREVKMKKILIPIAALALWGCSGDLIEPIEIPTDGEPSTSLADPKLSWSETVCKAVLGSENTFPTLSNQFGVTVTYTSSDPAVAVVDANGAVTLAGAGATVVTASSARTDTYEAASVSYALTVARGGAGLSWSAASAEIIIGGDYLLPTLSNPHDLAVTYSSSDESVASVDTRGTVTVKSDGTAIITASTEETALYEAESVSYSLTVSKSDQGISWSVDSCSATIGGTDNTFPTLGNPGKQTVSYSSSNESVATVGPDGVVILKSAGTTIITATSEESSTHVSASVSYTLTVEEKGVSLKSADLAWPATGYSATMGSPFPSPVLSNPYGLAVSYASSSPAVATVASDGTVSLVGAGTTTITVSSEATDTYAAGSAFYTLTVSKASVSLAWSESGCTATLGSEENRFPTLTVSPAGAPVVPVYTSSDPAVAAIDANGAVTLAGAGTTTISAIFEGNGVYMAASASYTLKVVNAVDEGAGVYTFASAGDPSSEDDIANTIFTRMVTVTYSTGGEAAVKGASSDISVSVSGNHVTVSNTGSECVVYKLTGTAADGSFTLSSSKKQAIWLSGVSITSRTGAAINNQSGKRTFVFVEGSNTLSDSSSAAYSTTGDTDMKGVFFSEGQLLFSGNGTLTVNADNAKSKSGIVSDDYVRFMSGPTVRVVAGTGAGHGVRGKEYVQISNGTLDITTKAAMKKGIGSDDYVLVEGGTSTITVSGGVAYDSEEAEYKGSAGIKADNYFAMTGGVLAITNTGNGGKGISAGSYDYDSQTHAVADSYISGGTLTIKTTGSESNDVSSKGIKIGWVTKSGSGDRAKVTGYAGNLKISGGKITVSCSKSEGIESKGNMVFTGGETYVSSTGDDAINAQAELNVSGGYIYAYSSANDAMDANHDMKLSGGYVFAVTTKGSPEVALDANTESGYKLYINSGATVVAYGGLERGYSASQSVYSMGCTAGNWNALSSGSSFIAAFKAPSGVSSVVVSAPSLSKGYKGVSVGSATYANGTWATSGISGGSSVSLSSYSGGSGGGGPGGRW